jgi:hypothetical protein
MEITEQNHAGKNSVVMIVDHYVVGVVLAQFKQRCLTHFEKFIIFIDFDVILGNSIGL